MRNEGSCYKTHLDLTSVTIWWYSHFPSSPTKALGMWKEPNRTILKICISFIFSLWRRPAPRDDVDPSQRPQAPPSSPATQPAIGNEWYISQVLYVTQILIILVIFSASLSEAMGQKTERVGGIQPVNEVISPCITSWFTFVFWDLNKIVIFTLSQNHHNVAHLT